MSINLTLSKKARKKLLALEAPKTPVDILVPQIQVPGKKKRKNRRKTKNSQQLSGPKSYNPAQAYIQTLNDPFVHGPVRLGWCTMVPTDLWTVYGRSTFTANADGTFVAVLLPTMNTPGSFSAPLNTNASGGSGTTWVGTTWANSSPLGNYIEEARVVSCGLRAIPQVPATSAPATVFAGSIPVTSQSEITAKTTNYFAGLPVLKMGYGCEGAVALSRPVDLGSYQFRLSVNYADNTTEMSVSSPAILFQGLPASSTIVLEYVMNVESIRGSNAASAAIQESSQSNDSDGPSLVDSFPSIESMWKGIKSALSDPGTVDNMARVGVNAARIGGMAYNTYAALRGRQNYFGVAGGRGVMIEEVP